MFKIACILLENKKVGFDQVLTQCTLISLCLRQKITPPLRENIPMSSTSYGAHKGTLSVVIFFISFVRNNISFVRNIISLVRNSQGPFFKKRHS